MKQKAASWRFGVLLIAALALMNLCRNFLWLLPSSLMAPMTADLGLTYSQAGSLTMMVTVLMGVFLIFGSVLLRRLGMVRAMILGLLSLVVDGVCTCFGSSYPVILAGKLFCGVGYGLTACATAALVAAVFPKERLGLVNSINTCLGNLTVTLAYSLLVPMYEGLNSWHLEAGLLAGLSLAAAVVLALWGREFPGKTVSADTQSRSNAVIQSMGYTTVRALAMTMGSTLLIYVSVNSYYPNYLHEGVSFSLETASAMTGLIAISGMVGGLIMGAVLPRIRKPRAVFLGLLATFGLGFAGMMNLRDRWSIVAVLCCYGASYNAMSTLAMTKIMQLPGIDPYTASAGISMMNALGSLLALFVPALQQMLALQMGLKGALFSFAAFLLPAFAGLLLLPANMEEPPKSLRKNTPNV